MSACVNCKELTTKLTNVITKDGVEEWCDDCVEPLETCGGCGGKSESESTSQWYGSKSKKMIPVCTVCVDTIAIAAHNWANLPVTLRAILKIDGSL